LNFKVETAHGFYLTVVSLAQIAALNGDGQAVILPDRWCLRPALVSGAVEETIRGDQGCFSVTPVTLLTALAVSRIAGKEQ
jgi:hypothetical protein